MIKKIISYVCVLLVVPCYGSGNLDTTYKNWQTIQEDSRNAIVHIFVVEKKFHWGHPYIVQSSEQVTGTGFFINEYGDIATCSHVIEDAVAVFIVMPSLGRQFLKAQVVGFCPEHDIALLRVDGEGLDIIRKKIGFVPYLSLGNSDCVQRGEEVIALGYPGTTIETHQLKGSTGVISARLNRLFQCDVATNPGNSGGPLMDRQGNVIGITSSGMKNAQNSNFAVPINTLKSLLPSLYQDTLVRIQSLGITWSYTTEEIRKYLNAADKEGCLVCEVDSDSVSDLHVYDIIYQVNGHLVDNYGEIRILADGDPIQFDHYISQLPLGTSVIFGIYRNGQPVQINITLNKSKESSIEKKYPAYETIDYEVFAGMIIMPLTVNYINIVAKHFPHSPLQRYLVHSYAHEPRLVISEVIHDSKIAQSKTISRGDTINEVNGEKVCTLTDFRRALQKSKETGIVTIITTDEKNLSSTNILSVLSLSDCCAETVALSRVNGYQLSETVKQLMEKFN